MTKKKKNNKNSKRREKLIEGGFYDGRFKQKVIGSKKKRYSEPNADDFCEDEE